jgi:hypothetical protein
VVRGRKSSEIFGCENPEIVCQDTLRIDTPKRMTVSMMSSNGGNRCRSLNTTLATCKNTSLIGAGQQSLWDKNVVPYLSMTVKGFLWYQGENNMHGAKSAPSSSSILTLFSDGILHR